MPMMDAQTRPISTTPTNMSGQAESQQKPARRIACERCRAAKVKCFKDNDNEENKCRRCNDAGIECSFAPIVTRRRRKRTDARVTALEEELRKIKSALQPPSESKATPPTSRRQRNVPLSPTSRLTPVNENDSSGASQRSNSDFGMAKSPISPQSSYGEPLSILSGLLSKNDAIKLLVDFMEDILPQYPILAFAEYETYDSLETEKPVLLLAVITAAVGAQNQALFQELHSHLVDILADSVFKRGEASLELIQSIMVMETWYNAPADVQRASFYQWIHASATMTLQLSLGECHTDSECERVSRRGSGNSVRGLSVESKTLLGCYLLCSCVAVSMRKECILGLNAAIRCALRELSTCATTISDRRLLASIRLQFIAEEALVLLSTYSQTQSQQPYEIPTLRAEILRLQGQYDEWKRTVDVDVMNDGLKLHYQYCRARLCEIPMHLQYNLHDLVPPFISTPSHKRLHTRPMLPLQTKTMASEIQDFVNACHDLLQTFLATPPDVLTQQPNVTFVRALYGIKALLILEEVVKAITAATPGVVCNLRMQHYQERVQKHLKAVYRGQNGTSLPLPLRMLEQITKLHVVSFPFTKECAKISGTSENVNDFSMPLMDASFWSQGTTQENLLASSSAAHIPDSAYAMDLDDTTKWLSGPLGIGSELWDMEYFPINV